MSPREEHPRPRDPLLEIELMDRCCAIQAEMEKRDMETPDPGLGLEPVELADDPVLDEL